MIETTLAKIEKEWIECRFEMKRYKDTFANIMTGTCL